MKDYAWWVWGREVWAWSAAGRRRHWWHMPVKRWLRCRRSSPAPPPHPPPCDRSVPQLRKLEQPVDVDGTPWPLDAAGNPIIK